MKSRARSALAAIVGTAALLTLAAAAHASDLTKPGAESELSSRLRLLAQRDLRSAPPAEQAQAVSLPAHGPASLSRERGALIVEVRVASHTRDRIDGLEAAGAETLHVSTEYRTVTVAVDERSLRALADAPGVESVTEVLKPMVAGAGDEASTRAPVSTCQGSVTSEGDAQLKAVNARAQFNVDGTGVKVGVLSDSFDRATAESTHAADDVASGDLPGPGNPCGRTTPVDVLDDTDSTGADEGRAMAQLVHDLAPGANLAFATAFTSETAFADNIRALAAAGSKVIVDDVTYFDEPFFQDGPVAVAVNDVTAQGIPYYSSAANNNRIVGGNDINSWEAPTYRDGGACPGVLAVFPSCMDFDPGAPVDTAFGITVPSGQDVLLDLQWAEPWFGVGTDLDLYVRNAAGTLVAASEDDNPNVTDQPFELAGFTNTGATQTFTISISRFSGATPRLKFVGLNNGAPNITASEYPTSANGDVVGPTIFGHNGADNAMSTAAVPFNNSSTVENFSSRGPVTQYFGPVSGTAGAQGLGSPQVLNKPDIGATDGGLTTFFGSGNRFFGTSAAAPHAAAVAALQLDANPAQTVAQVKDAQKSTADPVGAFDQTAVGSGLVDALGAVGSNPPAPPTVSVPSLGTTASATPSFSFTTTGDLSAVTCAIDGAAAQACASPFTAPPLGDGPHTLTVAATDYFGQSASGSGSVTVDATGPQQLKVSKPKKKTTKKKVKFTFSSEPGATFQCKLDKKAFRSCTSPKKVKAKKFGKHRFTVRVFDSLGNPGVSATRKWKRVE